MAAGGSYAASSTDGRVLVRGAIPGVASRKNRRIEYGRKSEMRTLRVFVDTGSKRRVCEYVVESVERNCRDDDQAIAGHDRRS